jgi:diguanylate cyclase (GGDEF)-like protein
MREAIEQLALPSPTPEGRVTVSIGVGFIAAVQGGRAHEVLTEADEALYQAKAEGRNRVRERGAR